MKIEVTIEGREPYTWPMAKDRIVVGSGDESDLVLKIKGISKKHALIVLEDDKFLVIDQGSAGGTFINDDQLVPGQRTEFNSFFPVRLGPHVMLSLLSDDEEETKTFEFGKSLTAPAAEKAPPLTPASAPAAKSAAPKASGGARAVDVSIGARASGVQGREGVGTRSSSKRRPSVPSAPVDADASRMKKVKLLAFLIAVGGAGIFFYTKPKPEEVIQVQNPAEEANKPVEVRQPPLNQLVLNFPAPAVQSLEEIRSNALCSSSVDFEMCKSLGLPQTTTTGAATGISLYPDRMVMVISRLAGPELWDKLGPLMGLSLDSKPSFPQTVDDRDALALFFLSLSETELAKITDQQQWLLATVLDDLGNIGKLYYAHLPELKKTAMARRSDLISLLRSQRFDAIEGMSGSFRLVELKTP